MSKRKGVTIYEKEKGKGWYGDFRRLGGKLEALIAKGERQATTARLFIQLPSLAFGVGHVLAVLPIMR